MDVVSEARELAAQHLQVPGMERRWAHVQGVASRAWELTPAVPADEAELLIAAAWLHDIGYAPGLVVTGFHALDGAEFLNCALWPKRIVALVAHHSGARFEAAERGRCMLDRLEKWPLEDSPLMDALVTADLTVGPDGEQMTYPERVAEIYSRYGPEHVVHRTWQRVNRECAVYLDRTAARMAAASQPM
ncbi:MAG TPA: phosphohydrolase [Micromonosporaceae bacterium]|nr:phosphohydrolase [Micromonosporaceae bacterium]HCU48446.1 phosphohydrolase [Micromonosporaceae bacterium]